MGRARVDQTVHRQRDKPPGPLQFTVRPDQRTRVLVEDNRRHHGNAKYCSRGRPPDHPVSRRRRVPPSSELRSQHYRNHVRK